MKSLIRIAKKLDEKGHFHFADQIEKMIRNAGSSVFDAAISKDVPLDKIPSKIIVREHSMQEMSEYLAHLHTRLQNYIEKAKKLKLLNKYNEIQHDIETVLFDWDIKIFLNRLNRKFNKTFYANVVKYENTYIESARVFFDLWLLCVKDYNELIDISGYDHVGKIQHIGSHQLRSSEKFFDTKELHASFFTRHLMSYRDILNILQDNDLDLHPSLIISLIKEDDLLNVYQSPRMYYSDKKWEKDNLSEEEENDRRKLMYFIKNKHPELYDVNKNNLTSFIKKEIKQVYEEKGYSDVEAINNYFYNVTAALDENEFVDAFMFTYNLTKGNTSVMLHGVSQDALMKIAKRIKNDGVYNTNVVKTIIGEYGYSEENLYELDELFSDEIKIIQNEIKKQISKSDKFPHAYTSIIINGFGGVENTIKFIEDDMQNVSILKRPETIPNLKDVFNDIRNKKREEADKAKKEIFSTAINKGVLKIERLDNLLDEIPLIYKEGERIGLDKNTIDEFASKIPVYFIDMYYWEQINHGDKNFLDIDMMDKKGVFVTSKKNHKGDNTPIIILNQNHLQNPNSVENKMAKNLGLDPNISQLITLSHEVFHWMLSVLTDDEVSFYEKEYNPFDLMGTIYRPSELLSYGIGNVSTLYSALIKALKDNISMPTVQKVIKEAAYSLLTSLPESQMYGIDSLEEMKQKKEVLENKIEETVEDYIIKRVDRQKRDIIKYMREIQLSQRPLKLKMIQGKINNLKQQMANEKDESIKRRISERIEDEIQSMKIIMSDAAIGSITDVAKMIVVGYMKDFFKVIAKHFGGDIAEAVRSSEWLVENVIGEDEKHHGESEYDDRPSSPRRLTTVIPVGPYEKKEDLPGFKYHRKLPTYTAKLKYIK